MNREQRLAQTFVELAESLVADFDVVDLMVLLTERSVEFLEVSAAGLLLADSSGTLRLMAATSEAAQAVELLQIQTDEGPCRDCFHSGAPVNVADLADETDRWPRFAAAATAAGFRAVHAIPLRLRGRTLGAMNLFRQEPEVFGRADLAVAQAFADVATIALHQNQAVDEAHLLTDQLEGALQSRIVIEQAKGIIAERAQCDMDAAFAQLRGFARARQRLLSEVAHDVVDGTLRPEEIRTPR